MDFHGLLVLQQCLIRAKFIFSFIRRLLIVPEFRMVFVDLALVRAASAAFTENTFVAFVISM